MFNGHCVVYATSVFHARDRFVIWQNDDWLRVNRLLIDWLQTVFTRRLLLFHLMNHHLIKWLICKLNVARTKKNNLFKPSRKTYCQACGTLQRFQLFWELFYPSVYHNVLQTCSDFQTTVNIARTCCSFCCHLNALERCETNKQMIVRQMVCEDTKAF